MKLRANAMKKENAKKISILVIVLSIIAFLIVLNNFQNRRFKMIEKIVKVNDVNIYTESIGNSKNPAILLMMGATASMIWWDDQFCKKLADRGYYIIRYDNRDTGKSTFYKSGTTPYTILDLADDAVAVLDSYKIGKAHLIGMSLGGMIAQVIAIRNPTLIKTMILVSSSVWDDLPELPPMEKKLTDYYSILATLDWTNKNEVQKYIIGNWRLMNGSKYSFDENRAIELANIEIERAKNIQSMFNHAMLKGGESLYGKSNQINLPVLIIHGTEDPVLPFPHALTLNKTIPNSTLLKLDGRGHEIHKEDWDLLIDNIYNHIKVSH